MQCMLKLLANPDTQMHRPTHPRVGSALAKTRVSAHSMNGIHVLMNIYIYITPWQSLVYASTDSTLGYGYYNV